MEASKQATEWNRTFSLLLTGLLCEKCAHWCGIHSLTCMLLFFFSSSEDPVNRVKMSVFRT